MFRLLAYRSHVRAATYSFRTSNLITKSSTVKYFSSSIPSDNVIVEVIGGGASAPELGYYPPHLVMSLIENVHLLADIPYWESIIAVSLGLRILLIPIAVKTVQGAARMAAMRPHMTRVQNAYNSNPNNADAGVKLRHQNELKAIMLKYKVQPVRSLLMPLFQLPIFISFFMGLRDMGQLFPGYATGGTFWFSDLSVADPYVILPILNGLSFLLMIELGSDGLQTSKKGTFKWFMRGISVAIIPLTMSMPVGLFLYWNTNNITSIVQSFILRNKYVKSKLDIPDMPEEEKSDAPNPITAFVNAVKREREVSDPNNIQIIGEITENALITSSAALKPPPVTYANKPVRKRNPQFAKETPSS